METERFNGMLERVRIYGHYAVVAAEVGLITAALGCEKKSRTTPSIQTPTATHQPVTPFINAFSSPRSIQEPDSQNPFLGKQFFVDLSSDAAKAEQHDLANGDQSDAKLLDVIAKNSTADWFGDWNSNITQDINNRVTQITQAGDYPVMVLYNIPDRDCGGYSAGGAKSPDEYKKWIQGVVNGINGREAAIIFEPDALGQLNNCGGQDEQTQRLQLMKDAIALLKSNPKISVFVEAAMYIHPIIMAQRLEEVGIENADGIALNTSGYTSIADAENYLAQLNTHLQTPVKAVIDTSRNGKPIKIDPSNPEGSWCNPKEAALGQKPTTETNDPQIEAFLWIKPPGESDGTCNGGSAAGQFWEQGAISLVKNTQ